MTSPEESLEGTISPERKKDHPQSENNPNYFALY